MQTKQTMNFEMFQRVQFLNACVMFSCLYILCSFQLENLHSFIQWCERDVEEQPARIHKELFEAC